MAFRTKELQQTLERDWVRYTDETEKQAIFHITNFFCSQQYEDLASREFDLEYIAAHLHLVTAMGKEIASYAQMGEDASEKAPEWLIRSQTDIADHLLELEEQKKTYQRKL
ncbi:hypothetical protein C5B42_03270 [Candidatus Cerribacteria bacterium 'Amazon FNV 2010 28 9']|uniref:Uncharacterized protein n=1 Tax=Candidatus Cerribacteria bacterium 'Amazon FNV 2010 28 9' TaxID=2081795 RepID=A0A317JNH7_9BACT|nr:MAG: hypothetical protein C5B42_03270 [Candidatus Cerribacteria bacterium 'Amazon FNV 2010 28 9']